MAPGVAVTAGDEDAVMASAVEEVDRVETVVESAVFVVLLVAV